MKRTTCIVIIALVCLVPAAAAAQSRNSSVQGFGGLTFGNADFVGTSTTSNLGAAVQVGLTPHIQIVGEGGRMSDISPGIYDLLEFTPVGIGVSAWYAQGGVRLIASPHAVVRPYGEATAGVARLRTNVTGVSGLPGGVLDSTLGFLDRTEPMFGLGTGLMLGVGPVAVDLGYRYRQIRTSGLPSLLNGGGAVGVNEVRIGLGVRF